MPGDPVFGPHGGQGCPTEIDELVTNFDVVPGEAANESIPAARGVREPPPGRRSAETIKMRIGGHTHYVTVGRYADGRLCEVFINTGKSGQTTRGYADALGVILSHYLQIGGDPCVIADKLRYSLFDPSGPVTGAPLDIDRASSPVDGLAQLLLKLQGCDE